VASAIRVYSGTGMGTVQHTSRRPLGWDGEPVTHSRYYASEDTVNNQPDPSDPPAVPPGMATAPRWALVRYA
jgi:hypothetical protein